MNIAKTQLAQEFRKLPTKSEKIMWNVLRNRQFMNLKFKRQYVIDGYIVDFYCFKLKLAIEIDGNIHQNKTKEDAERQKIIENSGIVFFRTSSEEVENNIDEVIKKLRSILNSSLLP